MKKEFNNKLSMAKVVLSFLEEQNPARLSIAPQLPAQIIQLKNGIDKISNLNMYQTINRSGFTINKKRAREEMTNFAINCAKALMAVTQSHSNTVLYNEILTTRTSLNRLRDHQVNRRCHFLFRRATEHQISLESFGITTEMLLKFKLSIDYHNEQIAKPRLSIVERVQLTEEIKEEFKKLSLLFNNMDTNINAIGILHPEFASHYKTCRITTNYRSKTLAMSGYIKDQTGKPLYGAICTIIELDREAKTTVKGKFEFKKIPTGNYTIQVKRPDQTTITQNVSIVRGQTTKLTLIMQPNLEILHVA